MPQDQSSRPARFLLLVSTLLLSIALVTGAPALAQVAISSTEDVSNGPFTSAPDASCDVKATELQPNLSSDFLREPAQAGHPFVVIGYYDLTQGLLAGYQSAAGKRIMFKAILSPKGVAAFSAAHLDPRTGKVETFIGPEKRNDASGKPTIVLQVAGVDLMPYLQEARKRPPAPRADAINDFLDSDTGQALLEAMPALYAALEPLETDPKLYKLQESLGVMMTALQAVTTKYSDFKHADDVVGLARAAQMREACHGRDCAYQGAHFTVHKNGMFDSFSKVKGGPAKKSAACPGAVAPSSGLPFLRTIVKANGQCGPEDEGPCFGMCGNGCFFRDYLGIAVYTPACQMHDLCVCMWSWSECVWFDSSNPPGGYCPGCVDLIDAAMDFFGELWQELLDWFSTTFGGEVPNVQIQ